MEKIRQFKKDESLLKYALSRAEAELGFKLNMIQLIDLLLSKACDNKLDLKVVKNNFNYGSYTSIRFDSKKLEAVKTKILKQGFVAPFDFIINHLFYSYVNNK